MFDEFGAHIIVYRAQDVWMHTNALKKSRYTRMHTHTHRQIHPHYTIDYTTYHLTELGANQFTDTSIVLFSFSIFSGVLFSLSIYSPVVLVFFYRSELCHQRISFFFTFVHTANLSPFFTSMEENKRKRTKIKQDRNLI